MIVDGEIVNHPLTLENISACYPQISEEDFKKNFALFEQTEEPVLGPYEVNEGKRYQWNNGVVKEVWNLRSMTEEEKRSKQENHRRAWQEQYPDLINWQFNEETCRYDPPVPYPDDGELYIWDVEENRWIYTYIRDGSESPL